MLLHSTHPHTHPLALLRHSVSLLFPVCFFSGSAMSYLKKGRAADLHRRHCCCCCCGCHRTSHGQTCYHTPPTQPPTHPSTCPALPQTVITPHKTGSAKRLDSLPRGCWRSSNMRHHQPTIPTNDIESSSVLMQRAVDGPRNALPHHTRERGP